MPFALICRDKPGLLQIRKDNRTAHLDYIAATGVVLIAGPFLDGSGAMNGSLLILTVDSLEAARDWAANDPYAKAGLFESVEIREWKRVVG